MRTVTLPTLGQYQQRWDELVATMALPSPFLCSWWLEATAAPRQEFVLVLDGDDLLGGLAVSVARRGRLEWVTLAGSGPLEPDHLDVVAAPGAEERVAYAVSNWLGRPGNRILDFAGLAAGGRLARTVPGRGVVLSSTPAPYVTLPATAAEYLSGRPGALRSTIKRAEKRLAKAGYAPHRIELAGVDDALENLQRLHDSRWGDESGFLAGWPGFCRAVQAGLAAGHVGLWELRNDDGDVAAIEIDFEVAGRVSFYQAGRSTSHECRGAGSVLRYQIISAAIDSGKVEFDLLRGAEPYKADWANASRGLLHLRKGVGPAAVALIAAADARRQLQSLRGARASAASGAALGPATTVLFYTDSTQIGGAESVAKNLLRELDERFEETIVGVDDHVVNELGRVRPSANQIVLPALTSRTDVAAMSAHRAAFRRVNPDLFHFNLAEGSSCQWAILVAQTIRGANIIAVENSPMGVRSELSRKLKAGAAKRFAAHVAVGDRAARLVEADIGAASGSVEVIPNAVPVLPHVRGTEAEVAVVSGARVVAVSRFDPVKGLDVLLRAVALADTVALDIIGDGPERAALEALISELGIEDRVTLLGWCEDARARLESYDLFVLPSRLEGMPMSLIEAMHAGIAVISTDVGSVREVVEDGVSGRVVAPEDPAGLAAAISELLADDKARSTMAEAGLARALERFSSTKNVAAYEALYDRVLS